MNNVEILTKAIEKAESRGWERPWRKHFHNWNLASSGYTDSVEEVYDVMRGKQNTGVVVHQDRSTTFISKEEIIYDHEFAKYFFGNDHWSEMYECLRDMVVSEDPLKYLERFL